MRWTMQNKYSRVLRNIPDSRDFDLIYKKVKKKKQYWQAAAVTWNSPWNLWDYIQLELFIYGYVLLIFDYYFNGFITFYYYNFFRIIFCNGLLW